ncbi:DUF2061 domain-containing protein [Marinobacter bohaiensis]|uniref:DUF2061 domain-containing protein n=1 Tax=Marinobacter bohaiensis TaxID=2201898 RepID=UPI0019550E7A|nr:DUF2061 domain-containing protein [Marinobacter bohaiensis]
MGVLKLFFHNHGAEGDHSLTKTITFACTHFTVAFTVAYVLTGDIIIGSLIAMVEPAINTVAYFFHEKLWNRRSQRNHGADSGRNDRPGDLCRGCPMTQMSSITAA